MKTPIWNLLRFTFILALAYVLVPQQALAQAEAYAYEFNPGPFPTITITKYIGPGGDVTIPSAIRFHQVTGIGGGAFSGCTNLTSVSIPGGVNWIGVGAFSQCTSLTNLSIPSSVSSIELYAFAGCTSLPRITIPSGVNSIWDGAFSGCTSLTNVAVPSTVTHIGDAAFSQCTSLTAITVDSQNSFYSSVDGVLFDKSRTTLIRCPGGKAGGYTIPQSVTSILGIGLLSDTAFAGCTHLTSIMIPGSVTSIGEYMFGSCISLTNVIMPDTVTYIGNSAFSGCTSLTAAYFSGNAPALGSSVFEGADNARVYRLPGTTGWSTTFADRPTSPWLLPHPVILNLGPNFGIQTNVFGFVISWATNASVVVEASTNLTNPNWSPVGTNTLTDGTSYFSDLQWRNYLERFYRLRSP